MPQLRKQLLEPLRLPTRFDPHSHGPLQPSVKGPHLLLSLVTQRPLQHLSRRLFFFQAEDGIRVGTVTGVQTCALPISSTTCSRSACPRSRRRCSPGASPTTARRRCTRSEEHTSELQSQFHLVCRLLLEKKKKKTMFQVRVQNKEM